MTRSAMSFVGRIAGLMSCVLLGLQACSSVSVPSSGGLPSSPLFPPDAPGITPYEETIRGEGDERPVCEESGACASAHFTLALVALYRNQAEAASHFRKVIEQAPETTTAEASKVWLRLLRANAYVERPRLFPRVAEQLVHQYLVAELRDRERIQALEHAVQTLERDLAARTRDVEKLTQQLEALKRIDREIEALRDKARPSSPPTGQETSEPSQDP